MSTDKDFAQSGAPAGMGLSPLPMSVNPLSAFTGMALDCLMPSPAPLQGGLLCQPPSVLLSGA